MTNKSHQKPEISISTSSEDETQEKAKVLGEYIRKGDLILLSVLVIKFQPPKLMNCLAWFFFVSGHSLVPSPPHKITGLIFILYISA